MTDRDEFYQVILEGIADYLDDRFIADILQTIIRFPDADLHYAINKNQIASKTWLLDELYRAGGRRLGTVYVLGGWYGVLGAMLLGDRRFDVARVVSVDVDPACAAVADSVNRAQAATGRFTALTADMCDLDYRYADGAPAPDVIINTSCEHLGRFDDWYGRVPKGMVQVLQSNDYFDCDEHVNCVADIAAFKRQAPMSETLFAGEMKRKRYTRFMLIGRK
ncbi:MAG: class I SAM-dependent methyltransferase [Alphaproteobacteria bacterium]